MNLAQLRHLIALAELRSFSRAAKAVHLTQPALSRSIRALEDELGLRLIDRIGKRNELSAAGAAVVERARRIVFETQALRDIAPALEEGLAGTLAIGLGSGPGAVLSVALLGHFAERRPNVRLTLARGSTALLLASLRERGLDALVVDVLSVPPAPDLAIEALPEMRGSFLCRRGHPLLSRRRRIGIDDLRRYPIASTPLSDVVARALVERYGPSAHPSELVTLRNDEIASLIEVAGRTDTVLLAIRAAAPGLAEIAVTPALALNGRFGIVTLRGRSDAPALPIARQLVHDLMRDR